MRFAEHSIATTLIPGKLPPWTVSPIALWEIFAQFHNQCIIFFSIHGKSLFMIIRFFQKSVGGFSHLPCATTCGIMYMCTYKAVGCHRSLRTLFQRLCDGVYTRQNMSCAFVLIKLSDPIVHRQRFRNWVYTKQNIILSMSLGPVLRQMYLCIFKIANC